MTVILAILGGGGSDWLLCASFWNWEPTSCLLDFSYSLWLHERVTHSSWS
jgi:hypothetical protein